MKTLKTLLFTSIFLISSNIYSQELRQFRTDEIISLFEKKQSDVYKILASKSYSYKGKDDVFDKFIKQTNFGDFIVNIVFKDGKIKGISTQEHNSIANQISIDFYKSNFKIRELRDINNAKKIEFEDRIIPFSGCFYLLNNLDKKITASFIISPYNPNVISLNYSRLTGKDYEKESKIVKQELKEIENIEDVKKDTINNDIDSSIVEKEKIENDTTILKKEELTANLNKYTLKNSSYLYSSTSVNGQKILIIEKGGEIFSEEKMALTKEKKKTSLNNVIGGKYLGQSDFIKCIYFDTLEKKHIGFILKSDILINQ